MDTRLRRFLAVATVAAALAAVVGVLVLRGDGDDVGTTGGDDAVRLEPLAASFEADFTAGLDLRDLGRGLALALPDVPPLGSGIAAAIGIPVDGDQPGLYGGSRQVGTCDVEQLVDFLTDPANRAKARAWAAVHEIEVDEIEGFIEDLTPVRLRFDTRVTNHGFSGGRATSLQSTLEAGTAVLVDERGVPRVKCACGNPLLAPRAAAAAASNPDDAWEGFDADTVAAVEPGEAVDRFVLVDVDDGVLFERPVGTDGETDREVTELGGLCGTFVASPTCTGRGGTEDEVMPDLAGSTAAAARRALVQLGFVGDISERREPSNAPPGTVIDHDPPAGREVPRKSPIVLVVSSGRGTTTTSSTSASSSTSSSSTSSSSSTTSTSASSSSTTSTTTSDRVVPDVVGLTRSQADAAIRNADLVPQGQPDFGSNEPPGTVTSQSPPAGSVVPAGSTVTYTFAEIIG